MDFFESSSCGPTVGSTFLDREDPEKKKHNEGQNCYTWNHVLLTHEKTSKHPTPEPPVSHPWMFSMPPGSNYFLLIDSYLHPFFFFFFITYIFPLAMSDLSLYMLRFGERPTSHSSLFL